VSLSGFVTGKMSTGRITEWRKLPVGLTELCLATTLRCGQSFRWKQQDGTWACSLRGRIVQLSQEPTHINYRSIWPNNIETPPTPPASAPPEADDEGDDTLDLLHHYLNLKPNLTDLYEQWSAADNNFKKKAPKFTGVRILRQDAWEALICFICSSNNNISRIMQMVDKLCLHYGPYIATLGGRAFHNFPQPSALTGDKVEAHLRELGFGYRGRFLVATARSVEDHEKGWLDSLRNPESPAFGQQYATGGEWKVEGRDGYRTAHEELLGLLGVGAKVADCVALFGLGWGEAVPIDTHVWQIAVRDYKFGKGKHSSLTKATYDSVANHFRKLWGQEAGWAHSVLFTADLRAFSEQLHAKIEVKEEKGQVKIEEVETIATTVVKRELDDVDAKPVLQLDELAVSSSERVKRRRRR
jgi:N-glycosylase/DNA lyase